MGEGREAQKGQDGREAGREVRMQGRREGRVGGSEGCSVDRCGREGRERGGTMFRSRGKKERMVRKGGSEGGEVGLESQKGWEGGREGGRYGGGRDGGQGKISQ